MQMRIRAIGVLSVMLSLFLGAGCEQAAQPSKTVVVQPPPPVNEAAMSENAARRFQEPGQESKTTVDSMVEMTKKYTQLADQASQLKLKNQQLVEENEHLKEQLDTAQAQLQQTQKELTEANDLLIEMRIELNNWKEDILGFRKEIRQADKTQLQALYKILQLLGGEVRPDAAKDAGAPSTTVPAETVPPQSNGPAAEESEDTNG